MKKLLTAIKMLLNTILLILWLLQTWESATSRLEISEKLSMLWKEPNSVFPLITTT